MVYNNSWQKIQRNKTTPASRFCIQSDIKGGFFEIGQGASWDGYIINNDGSVWPLPSVMRYKRFAHYVYFVHHKIRFFYFSSYFLPYSKIRTRLEVVLCLLKSAALKTISSGGYFIIAHIFSDCVASLHYLWLA